VKEILLDTHTFLWWVDDSPKLSIAAKEVIGDMDNSCRLSLVSCWEMAIKSRIGKLDLAIPLKEYIPRHVAANGFSLLSISCPSLFVMSSGLKPCPCTIETPLTDCWPRRPWPKKCSSSRLTPLLTDTG
jgi:hypothetical protein